MPDTRRPETKAFDALVRRQEGYVHRAMRALQAGYWMQAYDALAKARQIEAELAHIPVPLDV